MPCKKFKDAERKKYEESYDDMHQWTIYTLVDLKVVYIITVTYITVVNLISSTAHAHASTDKARVIPFDVSPEYMNVNVTSINDPVLWNCRRLSSNSEYYKFLYWMVIIVMMVVMFGFFSIKFVALITLSSNCGFKCCNCLCSTFKCGLTKLWQIAICKECIEVTTKKLSAQNQSSTEGESSTEGVSLTEARISIVMLCTLVSILALSVVKS